MAFKNSHALTIPDQDGNKSLRALWSNQTQPKVLINMKCKLVSLKKKKKKYKLSNGYKSSFIAVHATSP